MVGFVFLHFELSLSILSNRKSPTQHSITDLIESRRIWSHGDSVDLVPWRLLVDIKMARRRGAACLVGGGKA